MDPKTVKFLGILISVLGFVFTFRGIFGALCSTPGPNCYCGVSGCYRLDYNVGNPIGLAGIVLLFVGLFVYRSGTNT